MKIIEIKSVSYSFSGNVMAGAEKTFRKDFDRGLRIWQDSIKRHMKSEGRCRN